MSNAETQAIAEKAGFEWESLGFRDRMCFAKLVELAAAKERGLCINDCRELASHLRCFRDKQGASIADACAAVIDERGQKEGAC
jgi:hypothetical protein